MSLSALYHIVQTLKAVGSVPSLGSRFLKVLHDEVDVGVIGEEPNPVRVTSCKVTRLPINHEASAACSWVRRRRGTIRRGSRPSWGGADDLCYGVHRRSSFGSAGDALRVVVVVVFATVSRDACSGAIIGATSALSRCPRRFGYMMQLGAGKVIWDVPPGRFRHGRSHRAPVHHAAHPSLPMPVSSSPLPFRQFSPAPRDEKVTQRPQVLAYPSFGGPIQSLISGAERFA
ncbi:hypothetical protein KC350_g58 [Hortaea werneckii]|nr:hypothetical protein KC350_g58 [Hortaea werneckii]